MKIPPEAELEIIMQDADRGNNEARRKLESLGERDGY